MLEIGGGCRVKAEGRRELNASPDARRSVQLRRLVGYAGGACFPRFPGLRAGSARIPSRGRKQGVRLAPNWAALQHPESGAAVDADALAIGDEASSQRSAVRRCCWSSQAAVCAVAAWTLASSRKEHSLGEATGPLRTLLRASPNDATALVCADTPPDTVTAASRPRSQPQGRPGLGACLIIRETRWVGVLA
jgi:hypothetical protein